MRPRRRGRPESLGSLIPRVLDDLGFGAASAVMRIAQRWEEAVGPEIAGHCRPESLRGKTLEVGVDTSVWCQQLQLRTPEMLAGLRRAFGDEAPEKIWLKVGRSHRAEESPAKE